MSIEAVSIFKITFFKMLKVRRCDTKQDSKFYAFHIIVIFKECILISNRISAVL